MEAILKFEIKFEPQHISAVYTPTGRGGKRRLPRKIDWDDIANFKMNPERLLQRVYVWTSPRPIIELLLRPSNTGRS